MLVVCSRMLVVCSRMLLKYILVYVTLVYLYVTCMYSCGVLGMIAQSLVFISRRAPLSVFTDGENICISKIISSFK